MTAICQNVKKIANHLAKLAGMGDLLVFVMLHTSGINIVIFLYSLKNYGLMPNYVIQKTAE
jgi:hypothetical protein